MPSRVVTPLTVLLLAAALSPAATAPAMAASTSTSLMSLTSTGTKANGTSFLATVSNDGRWVAFLSEAANLRPPSAPAGRSLFLRDRARGVTQQVSVGPGGVQPDASINDVAMSGDGRSLAFYSNATTLAATPGGSQAFLWDRITGLTRRVSTNVAPANVYDKVYDVELSDDGRTFAYAASDAATSRSDVFVVDIGTGSVKRVAESAPGVASNGADTYAPGLSGDGTWVTYSSNASNLVTGDDNGKYDVFAENLVTGARERISLRSDEQQANQGSYFSSLSADGCLVAFNSAATNLVVGAELSGVKIFVRDRCHGETEAASVASNGTVGNGGGTPSISLDGCLVAFPTGGIFSPPPVGTGLALRDRCTGITSRADIATSGESANGPAFPSAPTLDGTRGRYIAVTSAATNLDLGDTDTTQDVFLRDRADVNTPPQAVAGIDATGSRVSVDATGSSDPDGYALTGAIGFGDGSPEVASLGAAHDYGRGGTYTLTVTVTDADGATDRIYRPITVADPPPASAGAPGAGTGTPAGSGSGSGARTTPGTTALKLAAARLTPARFAVAPTRGKPATGQGTTLAATLTGGAARLTLAIDRRVSGHRYRGRCVARGRPGPRCRTYSSVGSLTRSVKAGAVRVTFTGRLGSRALRPGRYRVRVSARAADGRRSATTTLAFTVVSRRHR